jgi:hypothetical protein
MAEISSWLNWATAFSRTAWVMEGMAQPPVAARLAWSTTDMDLSGETGAFIAGAFGILKQKLASVCQKIWYSSLEGNRTTSVPGYVGQAVPGPAVLKTGTLFV